MVKRRKYLIQTCVRIVTGKDIKGIKMKCTAKTPKGTKCDLEKGHIGYHEHIFWKGKQFKQKLLWADPPKPRTVIRI